jgi:hypothetical protein
MRLVLIALLLMAAPAQAADTAIQLSCAGLNGALNDSLVVNIAARTVSMARIGAVTNINRVDDVSISFVGSKTVEPLPGGNTAMLFVSGAINRLTGDLWVRSFTAQDGKFGSDNIDYLVCKPAIRLF